MAQYFKPVDLPEYCFLSEAVEWLAIGVVPEAEWEYDTGTGDAFERRFSAQFAPVSFQPRYEIEYFSKAEIAFAGVPFVPGYLEAAQICNAHRLKQIETELEELRLEGPSSFVDADGGAVDLYASLKKRYRATLREFAEDLVLVKDVDATFEPHFEAAWARLFNALVDGDLEFEAIDRERWVERKERQFFENAISFETLPAAAFQLGTDWRANAVVHEWHDYVAVRCRTDAIAELVVPNLLKTPAT